MYTKQKFYDKFGRDINLGDIVAIADWSNKIRVGKVYNITNWSVCFKYYGDKKVAISKYGQAYTTWNIEQPISPLDLQDTHLSPWRGYTSYPEKRLIILKRTTR